MSTTDVNEDELGKLLSLVQEVCTKSSIQNMLRTAKDTQNQAVRVSGSKEQVVSHLRGAVERNLISRQTVYRTLCSAEENGSQHIFFYRPCTQEIQAKCSDGEAIASRLLGNDWRAKHHFPEFHLRPTGVVWSDFRIEQAGDPKAHGWTAKLYAGLERLTFISEREESGGRVIKTYEKSLSREIYLVRWHNFGLLELRVPRDQSMKAILDSLSNLWMTFADAVSSEEFEPLDLTTASRALIDRHSTENLEYRLGDAHFIDGQTGTARFAPPSGEDDVMSEPSREQAIRFFNTCRELAVIWLPTTAVPAIEDELRTIIGKIRPNEILIASRATAEAVNYVTHRLWELATRAR